MAVRVIVLGSGSAGNATCIEGGGTRLLLDAGFSCRELTVRLEAAAIDPASIEALVITHEHADHIRGAARFASAWGARIHCTRETFRAASLDRRGAETFEPVEPGVAFAIGGLTLTPFAVPHDAVAAVGYAVACDGARVGYATDLGHGAAPVRDGLRDCDLLVLEANHDVDMLRRGPYPEVVKQRVLSRHGHLDNESSAALAAEVATGRTEHLVLAHLSRTNNRPALAVEATRRAFAAAGRRAPAIHPAAQDAASPWFEV